MKVSVCIPTFNQAAYIEQTIKSCTQQTLKPFEILVSNDCSTDNTLEVLKRLSQEISILKVINQPGNRGMVPNTDAVLRAATGGPSRRCATGTRCSSSRSDITGSLGRDPSAEAGLGARARGGPRNDSGRSVGQISLPRADRRARCRTFSSSRTLPGQSQIIS